MQFCLWSLNPAVAFRSIAEEARSIILTSGTLSPLDSFASEVCISAFDPVIAGLLMHKEHVNVCWNPMNSMLGDFLKGYDEHVHLLACADDVAVQLEATFPVRFEAPHVINTGMQVMMPIAILQFALVSLW